MLSANRIKKKALLLEQPVYFANFHFYLQFLSKWLLLIASQNENILFWENKKIKLLKELQKFLNLLNSLVSRESHSCCFLYCCWNKYSVFAVVFLFRKTNKLSLLRLFDLLFNDRYSVDNINANCAKRKMSWDRNLC